MYIEPVYMNEKMVLNCAAYLFKGVALESEISEGQSSKNKGNLTLGFKFLQELLSPISVSAEQQKEKNSDNQNGAPLHNGWAAYGID